MTPSARVNTSLANHAVGDSKGKRVYSTRQIVDVENGRNQSMPAVLPITLLGWTVIDGTDMSTILTHSGEDFAYDGYKCPTRPTKWTRGSALQRG